MKTKTAIIIISLILILLISLSLWYVLSRPVHYPPPILDDVCDRFGCQPGEDVCIDKYSVILAKDSATLCFVVTNKYLDRFDFTWDIDGPYLLYQNGSKSKMPLALTAMMTSESVDGLGPKKGEKKHILVEKGSVAQPGEYSFNVNVFRRVPSGAKQPYETEVFIVKIR